jgi:hypothetical protein
VLVLLADRGDSGLATLLLLALNVTQRLLVEGAWERNGFDLSLDDFGDRNHFGFGPCQVKWLRPRDLLELLLLDFLGRLALCEAVLAVGLAQARDNAVAVGREGTGDAAGGALFDEAQDLLDGG